jgi:hypothetical protein
VSCSGWVAAATLPSADSNALGQSDREHDGSCLILLEQKRDAELTYKKLAIASFALRALFDVVLSDYPPAARDVIQFAITRGNEAKHA